MTKSTTVVSIGDIEFDRELSLLTVPIETQTGEAISLEIGQAEYTLLWEYLNALRRKFPTSMGLQ